MLSSLSNYLPAGLLGSQDQNAKDREEKRSAPSPVPDSPSSTRESSDRWGHIPDIANGQGVGPDIGARKSKASKRDRSVNETFIIVRPPPSKSNHPLNLQVQLVPPASRATQHERDRSATADGRRSLDMSAPSPNTSYFDQHEAGLPSGIGRSDTPTSYSSSVASFSSTSTNSSGRRAIIPLYNLQAHNVMTNLVVDAGTDAKIAKFAKRTMELVNLASLEPIEVWDPEVLFSGGLLHSIHTPINSRPTTPEPSGLHSPNEPDMPIPSAGFAHPASPTSDSQPAHAGLVPKQGIFRKMFRKKNTGSTEQPSLSLASTLSPPASSTLETQPLSPTSKASKKVSVSIAKPVVAPPTPTLTLSPEPAPAPVLGPPVLGIQPTLALPPNYERDKGSRPTMYVWVVRKWFKGGEGLLGGLVGKFSKEGSVRPRTAVGQGVEVRFEWRRGKKRGGGQRSARDRKRESGRSATETTDRGDDDVAPPTSGSLEFPSSPRSPTHAQKRANRLSVASIGKLSINTVLTSEEDHVDDGEASDPEDSETPWSCVLMIRSLSPPPSPESGQKSEATKGGIKVRVAKLSPTPHHPKLVGLLKIPFPLPDIEVERALVRPRLGNVREGVDPGGNNGDTLILTAEEIKDVVSSTGLWLVVREGFGGVGRVNRKGDGWRIRG